MLVSTPGPSVTPGGGRGDLGPVHRQERELRSHERTTRLDQQNGGHQQ
jgi:hypothetical protein